MKSIKAYARWVRFLSVALIVFMICMFVRNWLGDLIPGTNLFFYPDSMLGMMSIGQRLAGLTVNGLFVGLLSGALYYCIKLMRRFEAGDVISPTTVTLLKKITGFLFCWAVYSPICQTLDVLVRTFNNPVGQRVFQIAISSNDIFVILICLFLLIITSIMQETCTIKAEQDLII